MLRISRYRIVLLCVSVCAVGLLGCGDEDDPDTGDVRAPSKVNDLAVDSAMSNSLTLTWTSVGDDGETGTASEYDVRYATSASTAWDQMTQAEDEPLPRLARQAENFEVGNLEANTAYHFRMRVADEVPNWSEESNEVSGTTLEDVVPPPPPTGMVLIEPGTFMMGSPIDETGRHFDETQHQVTLTQPFYICDHEVTQTEWTAVMGWSASHFQGDNLPVESITWFDAIVHCNRRSQAQGMSPAYTITYPTYEGNHLITAVVTWNQGSTGYRLPTEAEWEYACRAGSETAFTNGPITRTECAPLDSNLDLMGWYCGNSASNTQTVKMKARNAWGPYDMHGNVWEWCWDPWSEYPTGPVTDPTGPTTGSSRIARGGSWDDGAQACRSAVRYHNWPMTRSFNLGFRLARSAP